MEKYIVIGDIKQSFDSNLIMKNIKIVSAEAFIKEKYLEFEEWCRISIEENFFEQTYLEKLEIIKNYYEEDDYEKIFIASSKEEAINIKESLEKLKNENQKIDSWNQKIFEYKNNSLTFIK